MLGDKFQVRIREVMNCSQQVAVYFMHIRITCLFSVITNITASNIDKVYFQHFKFMWSTPDIRKVTPPIPYCY